MHLPSAAPAPRNAPVVQAGGDKLIPLRYAAGVVVDGILLSFSFLSSLSFLPFFSSSSSLSFLTTEEINFMLGSFFAVLQQTSDVNLILGIVGFLKEVTRELSYLQVAYQ